MLHGKREFHEFCTSVNAAHTLTHTFSCHCSASDCHRCCSCVTAAAAATSVDAARDGALGGTPDFSAPDFSEPDFSAPDFSPSAVLSTGAPGTRMAVAAFVEVLLLLVAASLVAALTSGLGNCSDSTWWW